MWRAANAVISAAAISFLRNGIEVVGVMHGYSGLVKYSQEQPLVEGRPCGDIAYSVLPEFPQAPVELPGEWLASAHRGAPARERSRRD